jgi:hypothetical protein
VIARFRERLDIRRSVDRPVPIRDLAIVTYWAVVWAVEEVFGVAAGSLNDDRIGGALDAVADAWRDRRIDRSYGHPKDHRTFDGGVGEVDPVVGVMESLRKTCGRRPLLLVGGSHPVACDDLRRRRGRLRRRILELDPLTTR